MQKFLQDASLLSIAFVNITPPSPGLAREYSMRTSKLSRHFSFYTSSRMT